MLILGTHAESGKGVISVHPRDALYHTAIIGQSGSGKSYFLARFLEELILRTKARVIVLDPNGDFNHFYLAQDKAHFALHSFETLRSDLHSSNSPAVTDYDSQSAFHDAWTSKGFHVASPDRSFRFSPRTKTLVTPLQLNWKWLQSEQDFLLNFADLGSPAVYQGANTCIKYAVANKVDYPQGYSLEDLEYIALDFGSKLIPVGQWPEALTLSETDWLHVRIHFRQLRKRFYRLWYRGRLYRKTSIPSDLTNYIFNGFRWNTWQTLVAGLSGLDLDHMLLAADAALYRIWKSAVGAWQSARQVQSDEIEAEILKGVDGQKVDEVQPESIEPEEAVDELGEGSEGAWSDKRVPTFVVIDEAHNFAPEEPSTPLQARVSDKIATLAAEGRKYGLFVVLATQRPQKLRKGLLSECENAALLRVQSRLERAHAAEAMGVPMETADQLGTFTTGIALLHGRWVPAPLKTRFAPARTILGGGGLDPDYWQTPYTGS